MNIDEEFLKIRRRTTKVTIPTVLALLVVVLAIIDFMNVTSLLLIVVSIIAVVILAVLKINKFMEVEIPCPSCKSNLYPIAHMRAKQSEVPRYCPWCGGKL